LTDRREKIAELYYRSGSIKFGNFKLSVHRDNPELPDSPWYLHYPPAEEPGAELLLGLFSVIGQEFHAMATSLKVHPTRIAGLPNGATGLGEAFAGQYEDDFPDNWLCFSKKQLADGTTEFSQPRGLYLPGDNLLPCEDHVSAARNNLLFLKHVRALGFIVTNLFVVVDRQQGAEGNLAANGVVLSRIMTGDYLLDYGLGENKITQTIYDTVQGYRAENEYYLPDIYAA
jgi:orotate phosphoribosyltransferase